MYNRTLYYSLKAGIVSLRSFYFLAQLGEYGRVVICCDLIPILGVKGLATLPHAPMLPVYELAPVLPRGEEDR